MCYYCHVGEAFERLTSVRHKKESNPYFRDRDLPLSAVCKLVSEPEA